MNITKVRNSSVHTYFTALMSEWQSVLVRTLVCVSVYQWNMLLQVPNVVTAF